MQPKRVNKIHDIEYSPDNHNMKLPLYTQWYLVLWCHKEMVSNSSHHFWPMESESPKTVMRAPQGTYGDRCPKGIIEASAKHNPCLLLLNPGCLDVTICPFLAICSVSGRHFNQRGDCLPQLIQRTKEYTFCVFMYYTHTRTTYVYTVTHLYK